MDRTYPEDWSFVQSNCYQMVSAVCVYDGIDASVRCIAPVAVLQHSFAYRGAEACTASCVKIAPKYY